MSIKDWILYRRTRRSLVGLVTSTLECQIRSLYRMTQIPAVMWEHEYCTVTFRGARQSGQTSAVLGLLPKFKRMVLVYTTPAKAKAAWDMLKDRRLRVTHLQHLRRLVAEGKKFDCIVFDDASYAPSATRNKLIQIARKCPTLRCTVFLG